jgi:plastocyanin
MKKLILTAIAAALLVLAGCGAVGNAAGQGNPVGGGGGTAAGTATITVNSFNFVPNNGSVTIKADQAVKFVDPAGTGGLHYLVTGTNGKLTPMSGAPPVLSTPNGMTINAGDSKTVTFANAGTFMITCTIHPYMEVTVVVTP